MILTYKRFKIRNSLDVHNKLINAGYSSNPHATWLTVNSYSMDAYKTNPPRGGHVVLNPEELDQYLLMPTRASQKLLLREFEKEHHEDLSN